MRFKNKPEKPVHIMYKREREGHRHFVHARTNHHLLQASQGLLAGNRAADLSAQAGSVKNISH